MLRRSLLCGLLAAAALAPAPAQAQDEEAVVTLYSRGNFGGARYVLYGPTQYIQVPFTVRSVRIPEGSRWELCSGNKYSGCREFTASDPGTVVSVRSARPVAPIVATAPSPTLSDAGAPGPSLRGMTSEYFVGPDEGGRRIEIPEGTAEAMSRKAGEFCRSRGWRASVYERLQEIGGRTYLADVLCADTED